MHGSAAQQVIREHYEDLRREAVRARPVPMARANRETGHYVVRDLSWECARHLETQDFSPSAPATTNRASRNQTTQRGTQK